jgi:RNA-directed DNA polymerase
MKRQGYLFDKIANFNAIRRAAKKAANGKRGTVQAASFLMDLEANAHELVSELITKSYQPRPYRVFTIRDPKPRTICAADFRDRVVQHALCTVLEPRLENYAIFDSYACRPKKGVHAAIRQAQNFAQHWSYYLKLDIRHHFETIDHEILKFQLKRLFKDERTLCLASLFLGREAPGALPGKGLPIGNLTSQHFANFYLGGLDHFIKETLHVKPYLRFMDDMLLFSNSLEELKNQKAAIEEFSWTALRLKLRHNATRLSAVCVGVPFLGFRLWPAMIRLSKTTTKRVCRKLKNIEYRYMADEISDEKAARCAQSVIAWVSTARTTRLMQSYYSERAP